MPHLLNCCRLALITLAFFTPSAQTWVDSLEQYAMERYLPASKYTWSWQHAAFLNTMVKRYHQSEAATKKDRLPQLRDQGHAPHHDWRQWQNTECRSLWARFGIST
jgi:hypothetical protein